MEVIEGSSMMAYSDRCVRDSLHRLIDELRLEDVRTEERVLPALNASSDRLVTALRNAPVDDEAETDAEHEATGRARKDSREGNTLSHEDVRRNLRRV
jgi:hypothetical protein